MRALPGADWDVTGCAANAAWTGGSVELVAAAPGLDETGAETELWAGDESASAISGWSETVSSNWGDAVTGLADGLDWRADWEEVVAPDSGRDNDVPDSAA